MDQPLEDVVLSGFHLLKDLTNRYGVEDAADLVTLADRRVEKGLFANRRVAVEAIEQQIARR